MATHQIIVSFIMDEMDGTPEESAEILESLIYESVGECKILDFWDIDSLVDA